MAFPGRAQSWARWDSLPWHDADVPRLSWDANPDRGYLPAAKPSASGGADVPPSEHRLSIVLCNCARAAVAAPGPEPAPCCDELV